MPTIPARSLWAGWAVALALTATGPGPAVATGTHDRAPTFDQTAALAASEAAVGRALGPHRLRDTGGRTVTIDDFRGRPLVVSLVYSSCSHTCPLLTQRLKRVVEVAREAVGADAFAVVTIGFDTRVDTPERMRLFARAQGVNLPGWTFLSADQPTVEALTAELGFVYRRSAQGFDHIAQTTVVDAEGVVYRQVYGESFEAPTLVEPLKQLVFGRRADATSLSGWINGVRLFCTIYDPASERYRFDYSLVVAVVIGVASLGSVAVFLLRAWRQSRPPGSTA